MGVRIQRDVRDAVALVHEELVRGKMPFHHRERGTSLCQTFGQFCATRMVSRQVTTDVTRGRHIRLMAVLLEEHPLQDLRTAELRRGHEARSFPEIPEDGI